MHSKIQTLGTLFSTDDFRDLGTLEDNTFPIDQQDDKAEQLQIIYRALFSGEIFLKKERTIPESAVQNEYQTLSKENDGEIHLSHTDDGPSGRAFVMARGGQFGEVLQKIFCHINFIVNDYILASSSCYSKTVGNCVVKTLGSYGEKGKVHDVLNILHMLTNHKQDLESELTQLMVTFYKGYDPDVLKHDFKQFLIAAYTDQPQQFSFAFKQQNIHDKFKRWDDDEIVNYCYTKFLSICLLNMIEITRRSPVEKTPGLKPKNKIILDNQYSLACQEIMLMNLSMTLHLLIQKQLSFNDVFEQNSKFGIPTLTKIREINDSIIYEKFINTHRCLIQYIQSLCPELNLNEKSILSVSGWAKLCSNILSNPKAPDTPNSKKGVSYQFSPDYQTPLKRKISGISLTVNHDGRENSNYKRRKLVFN